MLGGGSTPLDTYELSAPSPAPKGPRHSRVQMLVAEPTALKSLDGQEIVIQPSAGVVQYLKGAQWSDRLPRVVQAKLIEAFQLSGRVGGVGMPGQGLAIDYQVIADIRSFAIRLDGTPRADVEIYVRLLNDRNGVVRDGHLFSATAPVGGSGNAAFIAALDSAFNQVAADIVDWAVPRI